MRKKLRLLLIFLIVFINSYAINLDKSETQWLSKNKEITVGITNEFKPFFYLEDDSYKGLIIEYFKLYEKELDVKFKFETINSKIKGKNLINTYKIDILLGDLIDGDSINKKKIHNVGFNFPVVIYGNESSRFIYSVEDLKNKKIGLNSSTNYFYILEKEYNGLNIKSANNYLALITMLNRGQIDYVVGFYPNIQNEINRSIMDGFKISGKFHQNLNFPLEVNRKSYRIIEIIKKINENRYELINKINSNIISEKISISDKEESYKNLSFYLVLIISGFIAYITYLKFNDHSRSKYEKLLHDEIEKTKLAKKELSRINMSLVETFEDMNYYNDSDTGNHIKRVTQFSVLLAKGLNCENSFVEQIESYASLHDVGKIGIDPEILKKPAKLEDEEFKEMRKHPIIGYDLLKKIDLPKVAQNIARYHHEKWDGSGYPDNLKGEDIPLEARIVAIADVYDALRQDRVYKKGFSHTETTMMIIEQKSKHFDPKLIEIFLKKHEHFDEIFNILK